MLHVHVGGDHGLRGQALALAQRACRLPLQDALVRHHGAGVHIDAQEGGLGGGAQAQPGAGVVAQHVHAQGQTVHLLRHDAQGQRQGRHGLRWHRTAEEGLIAEVLDDHGVGTALDQGPGIGASALLHHLHRARVAWRTGRGRKVHHAHQERAPALLLQQRSKRPPHGLRHSAPGAFRSQGRRARGPAPPLGRRWCVEPRELGRIPPQVIRRSRGNDARTVPIP